MLRLSSQASSTAIFISSSVAFLVYLLGMRYHVFFPPVVFLVASSIMIAIVIYQCLFLKPHGSFGLIVLGEITILALLFHLIFQLPGYGIWGSDAYYDLSSLKSILATGFVRGLPSLTQNTSYFPMIHILGAEFSLVTGIDAFNTAKWLPSFISVASVPVLYFLFKRLFVEEKIALFAVLLFATLQHQMLFGSFFIRETLAIVFSIGCVYFYFTASRSLHPVAYRLLSVLFLCGVVLSHHFTSLMLILFFVVTFIVSKLSTRKTWKRWYFGNEITGEKVDLSILLIALVVTLTFWITSVILPLQVIANFFRDIINTESWGLGSYASSTGITGLHYPTLRYYFLIYGSYIAYLIFGVILLIQLRPKSGIPFSEIYSFTIYLFLCGLGAIVSFFLLPETIIGDRFLTFGWMFAFGSLVFVIYHFQHQWQRIAATIPLILFIAINVYSIHPTEWNPFAPGSSARASIEDFQLAKSLNFNSLSSIGHENNIEYVSFISDLNVVMAVYNEKNVMGTNAFSLSQPTELDQFQWVVVDRKGLDEQGLYSADSIAAISNMRNLDAVGSTTFNRIAESNNLVLFANRNVPLA